MRKKLKVISPLIIFLLVQVQIGFSQDINDPNGILIDLNGTQLFVHVIGTGEPMIIIHGGPVLDHSYMLKRFGPLAEDHTLYFYDQRLSGRSSAKVDTSNVNMNIFIEDIEALRKHFGLESAHILGHSWGGLLAMKYAIAYPSHTKTLILSNSMPPSTELWQEEQAVLAKQLTSQDSLARQELMQSELFKEKPSEAIEKLLLLSFKNQFYDTTLIDRLELYVPQDYMVRSQLFGNLMPYLSSYDLKAQLNKLDIPTLIIYGSAEPGASLSGPVLQNQIPESELNIIEQSGHFPFIEKPEEFFDLLKAFLKEHE